MTARRRIRLAGTANLVELIVVLVIAFLLAGVLVPEVFISRDRPTRENALQSLKALGNALVMYRTEFSAYPANGDVVAPLGKYTEVTRYLRDFEQVQITTYGAVKCVEAKLSNMKEVTPYWAVFCAECREQLRCSADDRATWFDCKEGLSEPGVAAVCP